MSGELALLGYGALKIGRWMHRPSVLALIEYHARIGANDRLFGPEAVIALTGDRKSILRTVANTAPRRAKAPWGLASVGKDHLVRSAGQALEAPDDGEEVLYRGCTLRLALPLSQLPRHPLIDTARLMGRLRSVEHGASCWTTSSDFQLYDQQIEVIMGLMSSNGQPLWAPIGDALGRLQRGIEGFDLSWDAPIAAAQPETRLPA